MCKQMGDGSVLRILSLENQEYVDYTMPFRGMRYDVLNYERQVDELKQRNREAGILKPGVERLCGLKKEDRLVPAYTLCLYHGAEKWEGPRSLADMMDFGENDTFREWFKDYPLHLYCANEAGTKDLSLFRTEVGMLLRAVPYQKDKVGLRKLMKESPEYQRVDRDTLEVLAVVLGSPEIWSEREKYLRGAMEDKEESDMEKYDMCQALKDWSEEERSEGRREGLKEGLKEGQETKLIQLTQRKLRKGKTAEEIAEDLEEPLENVERILEAVESCGTEDATEIYEFMNNKRITVK